MANLSGTATLYGAAAVPTLSGTVELSDAEPPLGGTAPTITTTTLANASQNVAASYTLAATGTAPITWSTVSGSLPAGLALNAGTGGISGTPTGYGASSFTVRATNASGSDDQALTLTVNEAGTVPVIATPSLAVGQVGTAYSGSVTATGTAPITWSVISGALPDGLTLNASSGAITGTPTTEQLRSATLCATNAAGTDEYAVTMMVVGSDGGWTRIPRDVEVWVRLPRDS
jgi:hypothetical protein